MTLPSWPAGVEANQDFNDAFHLIESGEPFVFVTGRAGTGKSTFIRSLMTMTKKRFAVVAPTGVAALNAGGQTIHSFFRFRPGPIDLNAILRQRSRRLYEKLELLIIDEISMVRADLMDGVERFLRMNGPDPELPFGGIQIVAVGDLYQLPPVVSDPEEMRMFGELYASEYFFSAHCLRREPMAVVELGKIYRQNEAMFIDLLNRIREGVDIERAIDELNRACLKPGADDGVTLAATNMIADRLNAMKLAALPGDEHTYLATVEGEFDLRKNLPAPSELTLKPGAQVMFTRNDPDKRWVNGTLAVVRRLLGDRIEVAVSTPDGDQYFDVERVSWDSVRYTFDDKEARIRADVIGSYNQLPLIPAWAITVHKSQGKTLDNVTIDLGSGAFAHGQVYVALSRCRAIENIRFKRPLKASDVRFDPRVKEFQASQSRRASMRPARSLF